MSCNALLFAISVVFAQVQEAAPKHILLFQKHDNSIYAGALGAVEELSLQDGRPPLKLMTSIILHECKWAQPIKNVITYEFPSMVNFLDISSYPLFEKGQPNFRFSQDGIWESDSCFTYGMMRKIPFRRLREFERLKEKWKELSEAKKKEYGKKALMGSGDFEFTDVMEDIRFKYLNEKLGDAFKAALASRTPLDAEARCNDFVPIDGNKLCLFTILNNQLYLHNVEILVGRKIDETRENIPTKYGTSSVVTPGFAEPFKAFQIRSDYYFVTKSGNVFALRQPDKKNAKMEVVWKKKTNPAELVVDDPVEVVFEDLDAKKTYAFTQTSGAAIGQGLFFELGREKEAKSYKLRAWAQADLPAAMRKGLEFYQVIEDNKAVKGRESGK